MGCTATENSKKFVKIIRKKWDCAICAAKTKALISCAVTAQLICVFVFAYADCWFSGAVAHFKLSSDMSKNHNKTYFCFMFVALIKSQINQCSMVVHNMIVK